MDTYISFTLLRMTNNFTKTLPWTKYSKLQQKCLQADILMSLTDEYKQNIV